MMDKYQLYFTWQSDPSALFGVLRGCSLKDRVGELIVINFLFIRVTSKAKAGMALYCMTS